MAQGHVIDKYLRARGERGAGVYTSDREFRGSGRARAWMLPARARGGVAGKALAFADEVRLSGAGLSGRWRGAEPKHFV